MADWTGDVDDNSQSTDDQRAVRKAVMRLVNEGDTPADTAQSVVHELFESLSGAREDERDEGATVETFDEGKHYYVMFTFNGDTKALDPDEARAYARALLEAADEAESRIRG